MTASQFYAFLAFLAIVYLFIKIAQDPTEEVDELRKKQKELYMMVQDCNQRYEELKARVNNLESKNE